jgi:hypothetical protein
MEAMLERGRSRICFGYVRVSLFLQHCLGICTAVVGYLEILSGLAAEVLQKHNVKQRCMRYETSR